MKRDFSPLYLGAVLLLICLIYRMVGGHYLGVMANVSPLMAIAFVGAMYLPRTWGWLLVPASVLLTEPAFLSTNHATDGSGQYFSWWTVGSVVAYCVLYAAAGWFGLFLTKSRTLLKIVAGSLLCSLVFYVASNTFSWIYDISIHMPDSYAPTLAGWVQANTTGLPGYAPSWMFLRNSMLSDLFFSLVLVFILDRTLIPGLAPVKSSTRSA